MRRVLVTGARGYVGRWTIEPLRALGFEVVVAGRAEGDLLRPGVPEALITAARPTHLLHLAWTTAHGRFWSDPTNADWLAATKVLLDAFAAHGGQRALIAGSCAELILAADGQPTTLYGQAKRDAARYGAALAARTGISHAHARLFFSYGPDEHPDRLVPAVIRALLRGERARLTTGTQVRDFLHVRDVAGALVAVLASDVTGPLDIGSGEAMTIADLARTIAGRLSRPDLLGLGDLPMRPDDPPHLVADRRGLDAVGFRPSLSLEAGIDDAIEWWRGR